MKKSVRILLTVIIAAFLLTAAVIPVFAADFDFESAVSEFTSTPLNTTKLEIGKTHTPSAALWTQTGAATCYSSDENIVTVAEDGTVTAVGEGTAYVAIQSMGTYNLYRYDVVSTGNNDSTANSIDGATQDGNSIKDDFNDKKDDLNDLFEQNKNKIEKEAEEARKEIEAASRRNKILFALIALPILALLTYIIVTALQLSVTSTKKKILPAQKQTANTIVTAPTDRNTYIVPINGKITAHKAETIINEWLAENPFVYDCKLNLETKSSLLSPFVKHKFFVKNAVIEYSVADRPQQHQYGLAFIYKFRFFGPIGYGTENHIAEWQANNTDCQVVSSKGGRIQHFGTSGFWAQYYNYVFFKK